MEKQRKDPKDYCMLETLTSKAIQVDDIFDDI